MDPGRLGTIQCMIWKDRKVVAGLSTQFFGLGSTVLRNRRVLSLKTSKVDYVRDHRTKGIMGTAPSRSYTTAQVACPHSHAMYCQQYGHVDTYGQLCAAYSCHRKSMRWEMTCVDWLFDTVTVNSYLIAKELPNSTFNVYRERRDGHAFFLERLGHQILQWAQQLVKSEASGPFYVPQIHLPKWYKETKPQAKISRYARGQPAKLGHNMVNSKGFSVRCDACYRMKSRSRTASLAGICKTQMHCSICLVHICALCQQEGVWDHDTNTLKAIGEIHSNFADWGIYFDQKRPRQRRGTSAQEVLTWKYAFTIPLGFCCLSP
jgi:hypothetical protein